MNWYKVAKFEPMNPRHWKNDPSVPNDRKVTPPGKTTKFELKETSNWTGKCIFLIDGIEAGVGQIEEDGVLKNFGVYPKYQGLGYGTIWYNLLEDNAKKRGLKTIKLSVRRNNGAAIEMYRNLGFRIYDDNSDIFQMFKKL